MMILRSKSNKEPPKIATHCLGTVILFTSQPTALCYVAGRFVVRPRQSQKIPSRLFRSTPEESQYAPPLPRRRRVRTAIDSQHANLQSRLFRSTPEDVRTAIARTAACAHRHYLATCKFAIETRTRTLRLCDFQSWAAAGRRLPETTADSAKQRVQCWTRVLPVVPSRLAVKWLGGLPVVPSRLAVKWLGGRGGRGGEGGGRREERRKRNNYSEATHANLPSRLFRSIPEEVRTAIAKTATGAHRHCCKRTLPNKYGRPRSGHCMGAYRSLLFSLSADPPGVERVRTIYSADGY